MSLRQVKCPSCDHVIEEWLTFSATMPSETRDLIESTMDAMRKDGFEFHRQRRMALGQMVEVLCAEYLASQT